MPEPKPPLVRDWQIEVADPGLVRSLAVATELPEPVAHLLVSRGIVTPEQVHAFFHPCLDQLHDPSLMLRMDRAVARVQAAVADGEPMLIYGDYDVDGTVATVLLKTAIERLGSPGQPVFVSSHVPHRIREGYGMQTARLAEAAAAGIRLVISVDTGMRAFAAAEQARVLGLDLIVTDHHLPDGADALPTAVAVLNPAQAGCPYPFKHLCGAAIAFKLAHALLLAHARDDDAQRFLRERLVPSFLKLLAIATIADSVPLIGENRAIAALGLRELVRPVQPGLKALMRVSAILEGRAPTASEVGFRLAPRINAAGRMDIADDVLELLLTRDPARAEELALKLDRLNEERRTTEREALAEIEGRLPELIDADGVYAAETLVLHGEAWHRGVLGILASRVVDRTGRPALVLTAEDQVAHGSGRSVEGFHLLAALEAAHAEECAEAAAGTLFDRFGGHAHAVGFSLPTGKIALLRDRLRRYCAGAFTPEMLSPPLRCDAEIPAVLLGPDLCETVERCAPFGNSHPEPVFLTRGLRLLSTPRIIKDRHVCLQLSRAVDDGPIQAMGWSREAEWIERCRGLEPGAEVDLLFHLRRRADAWFRGLELDLVALRPSTAEHEGA